MKANPDAAPWSPEELGQLRAALLEHYDRHRRALPWRGESDPYRVLVSEVMLQQTRAETVARRYAGWLERFPDLESLAGAEEDDVLKAWEGLGYYRRARNLRRTAVLARERPDAALPSTYDELRRLPGLGEYTAGAVASIAFGETVAAADGNVRRVISRLRSVATPKAAWLRRTATDLLDPARPGDWNQAMMELGATICSPRAPRCAACPVARWCAARAAGTQGQLPGHAQKRAPRAVTFALAVLHAGDRVLLERRPEDGLLGGMWSFPERGITDRAEGESAVLAIAADRRLRVAGDPISLPACTHKFTHLHATYVPWVLGVVPSAVQDNEGVEWIDARRPARIAIPTAQKRVLASFLQMES
jgi:A/G-specific adenine glycosylase